MEKNIELLGDMLISDNPKKGGKTPKKVFKKKKLKKTIDLKKERISTSKSKGRKRDKTTSVKKKKGGKKKKKRNPKGSPKLVKSQSIQLLSNPGKNPKSNLTPDKKTGLSSNKQSKARLHEKK